MLKTSVLIEICVYYRLIIRCIAFVCSVCWSFCCVCCVQYLAMFIVNEHG